MTHEELQQLLAERIELGVLPQPGQRYATAKVDESNHAEMPKHERVTVRYLTQTEALTVWVHYASCDFTGRGNEMFAGKDSLQLPDFRHRFPILLADD